LNRVCKPHGLVGWIGLHTTEGPPCKPGSAVQDPYFEVAEAAAQAAMEPGCAVDDPHFEVEEAAAEG